MSNHPGSRRPAARTSRGNTMATSAFDKPYRQLADALAGGENFNWLPSPSNGAENSSPWAQALGSRSPSSSPSRRPHDRAANNESDYDLPGQVAKLNMSNDRIPPFQGSGLRNTFGLAQDTLSTSARHPQSSPPYRATHTSSKSTQSQQFLHYMSNQTATNQALNQHAFSHNNSQSVDGSLNRMLNPGIGDWTPFNPSPQPWGNEGSAQRANGSSLRGSADLTSADMLKPQTHALHRGSIDRIASNLAEQGSSSPRAFTPTWNHAYPTRSVDQGRHVPNQIAQTSPVTQQQIANFYHPVYSDPNVLFPIGADAYTQRYTQPVHAAYHMNNHGLGTYAAYQNQNHHSQKQYSSKWLEDFCKKIKNRKCELSDAYCHIVECSGEQDASRFIQSKLQTANSDEKERVFSEIGDNALPLMTDIYGNYVIQKLMEHGNQMQKNRFVELMTGHMVELSLNKYGCRVVQKAVEVFLVEQTVGLVRELEANLINVMKHENGNHVVQKFVSNMPQQHLGFIVDIYEKHAVELSQDTQGCRVIQRLLEKCSAKESRRLLDALHPSMGMLAADSWGNYVVQHIVENGPSEDKDRIIDMVMRKLIPLTKDKISSNVVEKCITYGSHEQRNQIRERFCTFDANGKDMLSELINDSFGNYVVKSLVFHIQGPEKSDLQRRIYQHLERMKMSSSGLPKNLEPLWLLVEDAMPVPMQVQVDSAGPTPVLTNETNSPQSDGLLSANGSAIGVPSTDSKNSEATVKVHNDEA